jgi:hypothetical protein
MSPPARSSKHDFGWQTASALTGRRRYDLVDPAPDTIRALVQDPAVDDTHYIDRVRFALDGAERTARRGRIVHGDALVLATDGVAVTLAVFAGLLALVALSRPALTAALAHDVWASPSRLLLRAAHWLPSYALLTVLGGAAYSVALWFPPTNGDDLGYLSSVATIKNPLYYFIQDHGHGNGLYRPLTPVGIWLTYQVFGVWALPNQLINLTLHMVNVFLLYRIIRRAQSDKTVALMFAAVFMISEYTYLAATRVSDRPMVLTGLFLLLLVNHLSQHDAPAGHRSAAAVRLLSVAAFSVLALLSKESGLVVPALGLLFALVLGGETYLTPRRRFSLAVVTSSIMGLYVILRILVFGSEFASYSQDGFMFLGSVRYEDSDDLPQFLGYLNYAENVSKNAVAPMLPIFGDQGSLLERPSFVSYLPVIVSTALLFGLGVSRHLSRLQWMALIIIFVNAVVHFALFRFRLLYVSHAAFCLFVAGSPFWGTSQGHSIKGLAAKTLAVIALVGGVLWTSDALNGQMRDRNRELNRLPSEHVERHVVEHQVLLRYK